MKYRVGGLEIFRDEREIRRDGVSVRVRPMAFDLLVYLIEHRDRVLSKQEILENVWKGTAVTQNSLMQCIGELRKALDDDPREPALIKTVAKTGYRFIGTLEESNDGEPVPAPAVVPVRRAISRSVVWAALAGVVVVVVLVSAVWGRSTHASQISSTDLMTDNMDAYRYFTLGVQQAQHLHFKEAIELFEKAVALDPDFAMAHARIGYAYAIAGSDLDRGRPYLERAFRLMGRLNGRDRLYVAAWYAQVNRDYETAIRISRELVAKYPEEIEAYHQLAGLLLGEQQYADAEKAIQAELKASPSSAQAYNLLSTLCIETYRFDEAVRAAQHAVAISSREPNYYDTLGLAYEARGDFDDAQKSYRAALGLKPDFDVALIHLGNVWVRTGRYRDAMAQFEAYLHNAYLDWQRQRAYDSIALLYRLRGDMQQAREVARNAPNGDISVLLALDDRNVALANQILFRRPLSNERGRRITQRFQLDLYGERAMAEGKTAEGLDYFRQTLEARVPIWSLDWYEDCLAGAYARIGQTQEAIAEYQRVLTRFPKLAMSWYRLGAIYEKKGMDSQSEAAMRTFLDLWKNADDDIPERIAAQEFLTRRTAAARTAARAW